jgi:hypothetical protein
MTAPEKPTIFFTQLPTKFLYQGKWRTREEMLTIAASEESFPCVHPGTPPNCPWCASLKREIELARKP